MPIIFTTGDLFDSRADAIVVTINCVGAMGKGIALTCKQRYPEIYNFYHKACSEGAYEPGAIHVFDAYTPNVILAATKNHWRNRSEFIWVRDCVDELAHYLTKYPEHSIAIPPLGCGNGGLDWPVVRELLIEYLGHLPNQIYIYEP